jgi:hypothetical protein
MKPDIGDTGPDQQGLERTGDVAWFGRSANRTREDELGLPPAITGCSPSLALSIPMIMKRADEDLRQGKRAPASVRLERHDSECPIDPLERLPDMKDSGLHINIRPSETKGLALTQAQGQGDAIEGFEAITAGCLEENLALTRTQRLDLGFRGARRVDEGGDVAVDQAPLESLTKCSPEDGPDNLHRSWGQPLGQLRVDHGLDVLRGELVQLVVAQRRTEITTHVQSITLVGPGTHRGLHYIRQPTLQELTDLWSDPLQQPDLLPLTHGTTDR